VRIAFSGSHRVGKSTLLERVSEALPQYALVEEPYRLLEEDGYESVWPPSAEDFEVQLDRSVVEIQSAGKDVLFDRCPVDLLAYLLVNGQDIAAEIERSRRIMQLLDLVVLVPVEEPERVVLSPNEDRAWRRAVDETLAELLLDDEFVEDVLIVQGTVTARAAQVMTRVDNAAERAPGSSEGETR
jgi:predicted ATPase